MAPTEIESGKLTRAKTGLHASSKPILQCKDPGMKPNAATKWCGENIQINEVRTFPEECIPIQSEVFYEHFLEGRKKRGRGEFWQVETDIRRILK